MIAHAVVALDWTRTRLTRLRLTKATLLRMFGAGTAWGLIMGAGLVLERFWSCGLVCIDDAVMTTATSLAAGNLVFGPLVVLGTYAGRS